jgi:hypothetical protein
MFMDASVGFAKVYNTRIRLKDLESIVKKQVFSRDPRVFPNDPSTTSVLKQFWYDKVFSRNHCWKYSVHDVAISKKPKSRLIPFDIFQGDSGVEVTDLVTGRVYRSVRIDPYLADQGDALSMIYRSNDSIAVLVQVLKDDFSAAGFGVSHIGEDILMPEVQDIRGEPVYLPVWLVPLELKVNMGGEYYTYPLDVDKEMRELFANCPVAEDTRMYQDIKMSVIAKCGLYNSNLRMSVSGNLVLQGGVVCDGFIGRIMAGQVTDIVAKDLTDDGCRMEFR